MLTMRADFYARCADHPELAQRTAHSLALIGPMDIDELRQAIEQPARKVGSFFESGLVQTILDDVGAGSGALPLLEHALLEIWTRRVGDQLTLDGYVQAGRVQGALSRRAESVYSGFTTAQQQLARRMLLRLTQPGEGGEDTSRRASLRELRSIQANGADSFDAVLGRLVDARLLTSGRDEAGEQVVEVSHEALIRGWPRLQGWIDADRAGLLTHRRLTRAAEEWDTLKRHPTALYRGARLTSASEWAAEHPSDLSQLEREFLAAGQIAEASELELAKRRTRRLRSLATGLAVLVVLAGAATVLAVRASDRADAQRRFALSRSLATQAAANVDQDLDLAALLSLEAYHASPTHEARDMIVTLLPRLEQTQGALKGHTEGVASVAFSPDEKLLASGSADDTVRLWDLKRHRQLGKPLRGHTDAVTSVAFSPDGKTLASASEDRTVRLWDLETRRALGGRSWATPMRSPASPSAPTARP